MSQTMHIQVAINHAPEAVFRALTDTAALTKWFAEYADVSLAEKHYDFWGRFTPETPDRENGRHPLLAVEPNQALKYRWQLSGEATVVEMRLMPKGEQTIVVMQQSEFSQAGQYNTHTYEDFWFLSLENLRRYVDGKPTVRCDFSAVTTGDIHHSLEIDGSPEAVFATLIRPDQLNRWIASNATVEPYVGGRYDLGWNGAGPTKILEIVPNEKLVILAPQEANSPYGSGDTIVTWTLEASGGKTRLTIAHSGFAADAETDGLQFGWLNFMNWIRSLVEYGEEWQPPTVKLREGLEPYYAAAISAAQAAIITLEKTQETPQENNS
jgi:uncharacterized protein YndB with AHSA1/START domain